MSLDLCFPDLSVGGWQYLERPLGALKVGNSAMCGVKCSSMGRDHCGMFHYNQNTKDCTPVKVTELLLIFRSLSRLSLNIRFPALKLSTRFRRGCALARTG